MKNLDQFLIKYLKHLALNKLWLTAAWKKPQRTKLLLMRSLPNCETLCASFMRSTTILLNLILYSLSSFSATESLKGVWLTTEGYYIIITDTTGLVRKNTIKLPNLNIQARNDTLSFSYEAKYSSDREFNGNYELKIVSLTDSFLTIAPISEKAKQFYNNETTRFIRKEYLVDRSIKFQKIVFHTYACYGECPILNIQVDSSRHILWEGEEAGNQRLHGQFKGVVSNSTYDSLVSLLQNCNLRQLEFNPVLCCDLPLITLIIYYNGQRKYLQSIYPSPLAEDFIHFMYDIDKRVSLTKTDDKFELEE